MKSNLTELEKELLSALKDLLSFSKTYGPSKHATWEDWSSYFYESDKVIKKAERKAK